MKGRNLLVALSAGLIVAIGADAHHSFTATYDENAEVRIEGTLVAFHFRNPHASVDILAEDESGNMVRWGIEWGGAGQLANQGVTSQSLRAGDHVIITGNAACGCAACSGLPMATAGASRVRLSISGIRA